ncbi:MAG: hypothetical protein P1V97_34875, partial [Planctomycetota bacterium]|nr:hypothetical protein [Planctomycetota bacterium]
MNSLENNPGKWLYRMMLLSPFLLAFLIYAPAFSHDFVNYDDPVYVTNQAMVLKGLSWEGLYWAFSDFRFYNYHPLTWLSHMLDYQLFGLNPGAMHGVNVLLHGINGLLILLLIERLGAKRWQA